MKICMYIITLYRALSSPDLGPKLSKCRDSQNAKQEDSVNMLDPNKLLYIT